MRPRRGRVSYELPTSGASLLDPAAAPRSDAPGSSIDEEASIDPPPAVDAQTLSAYLYQHAETARQRSAALEAKLRAEEAAEVRGHRYNFPPTLAHRPLSFSHHCAFAAVQFVARAETEALQAELKQYNGWINEEIEGGYAFRLSKNLHDERERRAGLEREVAVLRRHLVDMSSELKEMVRMAASETAEQQQVRVADEALSSLEKLRMISEAAKGSVVVPRRRARDSREVARSAS